MDTTDKLPEVHPVHLQNGAWGMQSEIMLPLGTCVHCVSRNGKQWDTIAGDLVERTKWGYRYAIAKDRMMAASPSLPETRNQAVVTDADEFPF